MFRGEIIAGKRLVRVSRRVSPLFDCLFLTIPTFRVVLLAVLLLGTCDAYSISNMEGTPGSSDADEDWKGPSSGTKWISPFKNHLQGGRSDVRDGNDLAARVVGEEGAPPPRTGEHGVALEVALYYLPSSTAPLGACEHAISTAGVAFIARGLDVHDKFPTSPQR